MYILNVEFLYFYFNFYKEMRNVRNSENNFSKFRKQCKIIEDFEVFICKIFFWCLQRIIEEYRMGKIIYCSGLDK